MHEQESARPALEAFDDAFDLETPLPRCRSSEPIGLSPDPFEAGQVIEEGITRLRNKHRISRVAEQLEQKRVRLARRRGQKNAVRIGSNALSRVLGGDRLARRENSLR